MKSNFAFGTDSSELRVTNIPDGAKVRLRFRRGFFAEAFIKRPLACTRHYLRVVDGGLELTEAAGINRRAT